MKKPVFTGAGVAIITPFTSTGEVNYDEFKKILDYQIDHGTDAIIIVGTTGESSTMTPSRSTPRSLTLVVPMSQAVCRSSQAQARTTPPRRLS